MKNKEYDNLCLEHEKICEKIEQLNERAFEIEKELRILNSENKCKEVKR